MKTNVFFSVMFALLILTGGQSAVWWRLGPPESLATMLFSVGLLATLYLSKKRTKKSIAIFIVSLTLMSLPKEAFLISAPGFYLLLIELYVTVFVVGTNQIDYVGFPADWGLKDYLAGIWNNLMNGCVTHMMLALIMLCIMVTGFRRCVIPI